VLLAVLLCGSLGRASDADELDMFFGVAPAPPAPVPVTTYMVPDLPLPRQVEPELPASSRQLLSSAAEAEASQGVAGKNAPERHTEYGVRTRYADGVVEDAGGAFVQHDFEKVQSVGGQPSTQRLAAVTNRDPRASSPTRRLLQNANNNPLVTGIQPNSWQVEGNTEITVTGTNFEGGHLASFKCSFGGELSDAPIVVINQTALKCRAGKTKVGVGAFTIYSPSTNTYVETPPEVTFSAHASMFVSDQRNHQIFRFNADTGSFVDVFVKPGSGGLKGPGAMAFGLDGHFYVASQRTSSVLRYDGSNGTFISKFCTVQGQPRGLVFHYLDLYVTSALYDRVYRFNGMTGSPRGIYIDDGNVNQLDVPSAIIFDKDSNKAFVASQDTGHINLYKPPASGFDVGLGPAPYEKVWTNVRTPQISGMDLTVDSMYTVGPRPGKAFVRYLRADGNYMHHFEDENLLNPTDIKEYKDYVYIVSKNGIRKYNRLNGEYIRTHAVPTANTTGLDIGLNSLLFHKTHTSRYSDENRGS